MLAVLPLLFFGLCLIYLRATNGWRAALLKASIIWGLVVVASTEALSPFRALSFLPLLAVWAFAVLAAGLAIWRRRALLAGRLRPIEGGPSRRMVALALSPLAAIAVATGVIAVVAPPNTYDSMAYHMARVAHWLADGTVAHYPTNSVRQLYLSPWSEFAVLQLQVLWGTDHLANLVQWTSMIGSVAGTALIAQQLGAPPRGQVLAAVVVATLPMGILQASSTQTDYVLAFWLICCVALALSFVAQPTPQGAAWFASALGLAMLTKGTAYVFAAPLVIALGFWTVTRLRSRLALTVALMVVIPLLINAGYYLRNQALFHNPLAPAWENAQVVNANFGPQAIASNVIRDAVVQFGTPITSVNQWLERAVARTHSQALHIGVSDAATTFADATFHVNPLSRDEDYAGNPIQALLAVVAVLVTLGVFRRGPPLLVIYAGGLLAAYLFFAAYLKWQPWSSRLELPLLVLAGPLIGVVLARRASVAVVGVLATVLFVASIPWVIDNQTRPLVGFGLPAQPRNFPAGVTIFNTSRTDLYFAKNQALEAIYLRVAASADQVGCREIGFWSGPADWEYPLWVLTEQKKFPTRIDAVLVDNDSRNARRFGAQPCLVVAVVPKQPESITLDGVEFARSWRDGGVSLYGPPASR